MEQARDVLRRILDEAPGSIRELGRAVGLSHVQLMRLRDGERRLTKNSRRAIVSALRRWSETCAELADALEAAPDPGRGGGHDGE